MRKMFLFRSYRSSSKAMSEGGQNRFLAITLAKPNRNKLFLATIVGLKKKKILSIPLGPGRVSAAGSHFG